MTKSFDIGNVRNNVRFICYMQATKRKKEGKGGKHFFMEGELTPLDTMLTDYWLLSYQSTDKVISS